MAQSPLPHPRSRTVLGGTSYWWMDTPCDIRPRKAVVQSSLRNAATQIRFRWRCAQRFAAEQTHIERAGARGGVATGGTSRTHPTKSSLRNWTGLTRPAWRRFSARCLTSSSWTSRVTPVAAESLFWVTVILVVRGRCSRATCAAQKNGRDERGQEGSEQAQVAWGAQPVGFLSVLRLQAKAAVLGPSSTRTRAVFPARHRPWLHLGPRPPPRRLAATRSLPNRRVSHSR